MKIAIIGAGFGEMAAAYEIAKAGHEAVLIERTITRWSSGHILGRWPGSRKILSPLARYG